MKYFVTLAVDGRIEVEVDAENFNDAKEKAYSKVRDIDLGSLRDTDWTAVNAENENGEFLDY